MKDLYHWTSRHHLPRILQDGFLKTTESNVGSPALTYKPAGEHVGPDVVWLLDTPVVRFNHGLQGAAVDKTEVRFTVRAPGAVRWLDWAPAQDMHPMWRKGFLKGAGGMAAARSWWVIEREIPRDEWTEIRVGGNVLDFTTADW